MRGYARMTSKHRRRATKMLRRMRQHLAGSKHPHFVQKLRRVNIVLYRIARETRS
jgi:hypothetical protein